MVYFTINSLYYVIHKTAQSHSSCKIHAQERFYSGYFCICRKKRLWNDEFVTYLWERMHAIKSQMSQCENRLWEGPLFGLTDFQMNQTKQKSARPKTDALNHILYQEFTFHCLHSVPLVEINRTDEQTHCMFRAHVQFFSRLPHFDIPQSEMLSTIFFFHLLDYISFYRISKSSDRGRNKNRTWPQNITIVHSSDK